jgi:hypothetical protein
MRRRFTRVGLVSSGASFVLLAAAWYVLNRFRRYYYDSSVESATSATSPYWAIVSVQHFLQWPIILSFGVAALMLLFESAHYIAGLVSPKTNGKRE